MKILVDTSVWIRFLRGTAPFLPQLRELLTMQVVLEHPMIYGELLMGDSSGRLAILRDYRSLEAATVLSHTHAVDFVRKNRLHGLGIGWVDAHVLASAYYDGASVWTADRGMAAVAEHLGIAFSA